MEILKKKRKVIRSQVTRFANDADKLLNSASAVDLEEEGEKDGAATPDPDCASTMLSSSGSSHRPPLRHLLRFFELELQSRERTQEDRPDDPSGTEILSVGVLGGTHSQRTFRRVEVCLISADDGRVLKIEALETPSICEQLIPCPTEEVKTILLELSLPVGDDSQQSLSPTIDVLIGSDHFWDFLTGKVKKLTGALTAFETVFGWAVQGKASTACKRINCAQAIVLRTTVTDQETAPILKAFWELESIGVSDLSDTAADERLMKGFSDNIKEVNGRYEVKLPWKNEVELADNRAVAEKRFRPLWTTQGEEMWPIEQRSGSFTPEELEQKKGIQVLNAAVNDEGELLDLARFSSAIKVDRVTAWVLRFAKNLRARIKTSGPLTAEEIERAHIFWLKKAQNSAFYNELRNTANGSALPSNSPLKDFTLWTDSDGLLRIRGRIASQNSCELCLF
ncbi:hypothetical protein MTO96_032599 [Rhipicephalus appendiculatus]